MGTAAGTPEAFQSRDLPGEGAIVSLHGERSAAYRDEANTLHTLSPVCTHLACYVNWNRAEKTWDCPCHGSRFGAEGAVIQGPAVRDLAPVDVERLQAK